jgi:hypothetical protein
LEGDIEKEKEVDVSIRLPRTAGKTLERAAEPPPGPFDGIGKIGEKLAESLEKAATVVVVVLALVLAIEVAK